MSVADGGNSSNLVQRVQDILLRPKPTWEVIDTEPATVNGLYTGYAMILAALPAAAGLLGNLALKRLLHRAIPARVPVRLRRIDVIIDDQSAARHRPFVRMDFFMRRAFRQ